VILRVGVDSENGVVDTENHKAVVGETEGGREGGKEGGRASEREGGREGTARALLAPEVIVMIVVNNPVVKWLLTTIERASERERERERDRETERQRGRESTLLVRHWSSF
jgi:hypothetical protein